MEENLLSQWRHDVKLSAHIRLSFRISSMLEAVIRKYAMSLTKFGI